MPKSRWFGRLGALGLVVVSTALGAVAVEGVLRLVVNPSDFLHATLIDDPMLGHRIAPHTTGHDGLGFRNREVPKQVGIVAIGDSNTYGVSATREGSWPHQLSIELGEPVYNMGLGGYGPLQYLHLAEATAGPLKPRLLIVGFYFGNDLMDAHLVAHANERWREWRRAERPAEGTAAPGPVADEPKKRFETLRNWLSRNSVLYSVLRATVFQRLAVKEREAMVRQASPDSRWPWRDPARGATVQTVFTPQVRLSAVDVSLPAVREGLDITKKAFAALRTEAERQRVRLLVVLIPTKERAYCRHLRVLAADLPPSFVRLCEVEEAAKAELMAFLAEQRMAQLDVTPMLEAQIERHVQLYPTDADGHAQAAGYGVIAKAVAEIVRQDSRKP